MIQSRNNRKVRPSINLKVTKAENQSTSRPQLKKPNQIFMQRMPSAIAISTSDGIEILKIADITHCTADSNYCEIHIRDGRSILVSKTLKVIEAAIASRNFLRVHQSHLVNLSDIQKITFNSIQLCSGIRLPVSRSKRSILMEKISEQVAIV